MNDIAERLHRISENTKKNIQFVDTIIPLVDEIKRLRLILETRSGDLAAVEKSWDKLQDENLILRKTIEEMRDTANNLAKRNL